MAVTTNAIGTYTYQLDYPAGTTVGELQTAIDGVLVAHGWDQYDASAGTNAIAYRAVNKDGSTYKYVVIDLNTAGRALCKVYESWDSGAHTGTNLCYLSDSANYSQKVDLANGALLYINLSARWLILLSRVSGAYGSNYAGVANGCFEVTRDNPEDTAGAGYPCWISCGVGLTIGGLSYHNYIDNANYTPRTRSGLTASNAKVALSSIFGGNVTSSNYSSFPVAVSSWSGKYQVSTLWDLEAQTSNYHEYKGRVYGAKVLPTSSASLMDEVSLKVDSDLFVSSSGTPTDHIVLGLYSSLPRLVVPK